MQMNRHGRRAHSEEICDLFRRSVIEVEQDEGGPLPGRELGEREENLESSIVDPSGDQVGEASLRHSGGPHGSSLC